MDGWILAIDAGTTSVRSMAFGHGGEVLAVSQRAVSQMYPGDGMVEHDPIEIRDAAVATAKECLARMGGPEGCRAIGITNQRETAVVWEKETGRPVCNAIVWQDRRTADICKGLTDSGHAQRILSTTGLQIDSYFSGTKLKWILDNVPGARKRAEGGELLFGTVETWLIWCLTGGRSHETDHSNASRTMMFDIRKLDWDDGLLGILDVPRCMLPEPVPSSHIFGETSEDVLGARIPIAAAMGDQQSALFGQSCFSEGDVKITFGTGGFLLMNTGRAPADPASGILSTVAWTSEGETAYALEGSVYIAGAAVQWLRDELQIVEESWETERMAESVDDTCGCYVVPAFTGLGAPYWVQNARGVITGLTRATNRCHIARAALESIAFQAHDVIRAMESDSGKSISSIKVDGGASANGFLCQFLADITGTVVERPKCIESTALGAAHMAGIETGFWDGAGDLKGIWSLDRRFVPSMPESVRKEKLRGWKDALGYVGRGAGADI